jgi:molybdopterin/thiamine biosynthesis adenylyltransferase
MSAIPNRYDRNIRLFGEEGQRKLRRTSVVLVGVGGLGSPLAQHLALLGIGKATLVDDDELDETSRNRFVGARQDDPVPGSPKVAIAGRLIREINPDIEVTALKAGLVTLEAFDAVKSADWVFGGFDEDGPRFILNELSAAYAKPYIDLASDVPEPGVYGGRVCVAWDGNACLHCLDLLDPDDVRRYLSSEREQAAQAAIYGVPRAALGEAGPSVSPVNGVVASLAATEFMVAITGMAEPRRLINYTGHLLRLTTAKAPETDCPYCKGIRGQGAKADVERYLKMPHLKTGRKR